MRKQHLKIYLFYFCIFAFILLNKYSYSQNSCEIYSLVLNTLKTVKLKDIGIDKKIDPLNLDKLDSLSSEFIINYKFLIRKNANLLSVNDLIRYNILKKNFLKRYKNTKSKICNCAVSKFNGSLCLTDYPFISEKDNYMVNETYSLVEMDVSPIFSNHNKALLYLINRYHIANANSTKSQDKLFIFYLSRKNKKSTWEISNYDVKFHQNRPLMKY